MIHVRYLIAFAATSGLLGLANGSTPAPAAADAAVVETVGAPVRTATTAQLNGRVDPRGSATTYRFEYGDQGPCEAHPCISTPSRPAGSGVLVELASAEVKGLEPGHTYHYRIVAENESTETPSVGTDMTVTTRMSDAPLTHGRFPGPPGSDRGYEQVNAPDIGGNPVEASFVISDDGNRAVYGVAGGTPTSRTGGFNQFFAERTTSGWQTKDVYPEREELPVNSWAQPIGRSDLSTYFVINFSFVSGSRAFRINPGAPAQELFQNPTGVPDAFIASQDGSRAVIGARGTRDPEHPVASEFSSYLYDISSGSARMISLLPGDTVPACGVAEMGSQTGADRSTRWLSTDGNLLFFPSKGDDCSGSPRLYLRDLTAGETKLISAPALSGPDCSASFIKSAPGAAFFWTKSRLAADDTTPAGCSDSPPDGDVYRYRIDDGSLECVSCVASISADVPLFSNPGEAELTIGVAPDGSRVYLESPHSLLTGAAVNGIYRVDVGSGDLAYLGSGDIGGGESNSGSAINPDGSVIIFRSSALSLNPLGDTSDNGGTEQYYRYDDRDRSLICVSCPHDGSAPRGPVPPYAMFGGGISSAPLSADGATFAFSTPTSLAGVDQNTAAPGQEVARGQDAYEWRDGRLLLLSDGLTDWPSREAAPAVRGTNPSGHDILFTVAAPYTPDALDDFKRLYDARIGGGFEFPPPPPPCPLEVCQGTPAGAPEEAAAGTVAFAGPGDSTRRRPPRCGKGKIRRRGRCVPRKGRHARRHAALTRGRR